MMSQDRHCGWLGKFARQISPAEQDHIDALRADGQWPPPYTYLFTDFIPMLRERGMHDDEIFSILDDNPRRFFAGEALSNKVKGASGMRAVVNTPGGATPVELRDVPEPGPGPNEAVVAVRAFSLNRGELRSFVNNETGWIPGQDISGVVLQAAANPDRSGGRVRVSSP